MHQISNFQPRKPLHFWEINKIVLPKRICESYRTQAGPEPTTAKSDVNSYWLKLGSI
jgi:hypothetical protein